MRPDFQFNYTGAFFPDYIKVKKKLRVWPLDFSATGIVNVTTGEWSHRLSCKDVLIRGKLLLINSNAIEYRKNFGVPFLRMADGFASLVATARWDLNNPHLSWRPKVRIGFEFGQGNAQMLHANSVRWKPKMFLTKHMGIEALSHTTFTLPRQLQFNVTSSLDDDDFVEMDDTLRVKMEVKQLNLVFRF